MVLEMAASVDSWKAACMRTCQSGAMSGAVTKTPLTHSGASGLSWRELPVESHSAISSL